MSDSQHVFVMGHVNELYKRIESLVSDIQAFYDKLQKLSEIDVCKEKIEKFDSFLKSMHEACATLHKGHSSGIASLESAVTENIKQIDGLKDVTKRIFDQWTVEEKKWTARFEAQASNFNTVASNLRSEFNKSLEVLKGQIGASPASILESNQSILKKFEATQMDASNAMLKMNNAESTQILFSRKLENLELRMKKLEIEKQL